MTQLYKLTAQHKELELLADSDNELDLADTFEALEGEFNDKAISLINVVKNKDGDLLAIDDAIKRLQDRKKSIVSNQDSMKEYLRNNMEASGITKIECPLFSITLAKGRQVVTVLDQDKIPADYLNIKTSVAPIKADILKALKAGEEIPGCELSTSKTSLRIK